MHFAHEHASMPFMRELGESGGVIGQGCIHSASTLRPTEGSLSGPAGDQPALHPSLGRMAPLHATAPTHRRQLLAAAEAAACKHTEIACHERRARGLCSACGGACGRTIHSAEWSYGRAEGQRSTGTLAFTNLQLAAMPSRPPAVEQCPFHPQCYGPSGFSPHERC
jgi:hypothetical protein